MTRVVAVVQARMGSSRFPGKMLASLGDSSLLTWVLTRVTNAKQVDEVVLATTFDSRDDQLVEQATALKVRVVRGSQDDVLARFIQASDESKADLIVRVCADNPFVAPEEIDRLVDAHKKSRFDYSCNHQQRLENKYADGFGAEIVSADLLRQISLITTTTSHREHVTSYIWDNATKFKINAIQAPIELAYPEIELDIDIEQDLAYLNEFVTKFSITMRSSAAEIIVAFNKFRNI